MTFGVLRIEPGSARGPSNRGAAWYDGFLDRLGIFGQSLGLLYLKPSLFMPAFVMRRRLVLNALFAWTYAVAFLIDAQAIRHGRSSPPLFAGNWAEQWAFFALGGLALGAFLWTFGGWWYEVRLWWAGVNPIDEGRARSCYLVSAQIQALPTILWTAGETLFYETPLEALGAGSLWILPLAILPFWSIRVSHLGVRSVFEGSRAAIRFWFLVLPMVGVFLPLLLGTAFLVFGK